MNAADKGCDLKLILGLHVDRNSLAIFQALKIYL